MNKGFNDNKSSPRFLMDNGHKFSAGLQKQNMSLEKLQKLLSGSIIGIDSISSGMTNVNFKCTLDNAKKYIVRIPGAGSEHLVDRTQEEQILKKVEPLGIDCKTVFFDKVSGIKVTEYIEDCTVLIGKSVREIHIGAKMLGQLHRSGLNFENRFDFWKMIERYKKVCMSLGINHKSPLEHMLKRLKKLEDSLALNRIRFMPCHNDIVPENILLKNNGKISLIDWEYGGMNDPVWDLAAFALESGLTEVEEDVFLRAYYGLEHDPKAMGNKMLLNKIRQDFLWYIWSEIKLFYGQDVFEYKKMRYERGMKNFNRLLHLTKVYV